VMGFVDMPNIRRTPAVPGLALLGDAAMSLDPVWGSGCTWAFRSAEWLVDLTAPAVARGAGIDRAAKAYARRHRKELGGHAWHIQSYATGRDWWLPERMMIEAAVHDPACARHLFAYSTRNIGILRFMAPVARLRAARVVMAARLKGFRARRQPDRPVLDVAA
jgi:2-polyprenyl-6-methoxyphenol hydroxylase-like FAD-dependent oxidoreductase